MTRKTTDYRAVRVDAIRAIHAALTDAGHSAVSGAGMGATPEWWADTAADVAENLSALAENLREANEILADK